LVGLSKQTFRAGAVATAWVAPIAAAAISIALYEGGIFSSSPRLVLAWSILAALIFWVLTAIAYSPMTGPMLANARSYWLLKARIDGLRKRRVKVCQAIEGDPNCVEAHDGIAVADLMLKDSGLQWVSQRGYIALWERTHRAEEALMEAEDKEELMLDVEHMTLQLHGAEIPQKDELLKLLNSAKTGLSKPKPDDGISKESVSVAEEVRYKEGIGKDSRSAAEEFRLEMRISDDSLSVPQKALKEVRYNINVFRDNQWSGMVALRNQILATLVFAELAGFAVLALAILNSADLKLVAAGALYFLVGAVFGLFNRLYSESQVDHVVDDYGLAMAGIVTLPVYSGLAGLGGVVLSTLTSGPPGASSLSAIFDVQNHPLVLVAAAAFGLAPALLVGALTDKAKQYASAVKSTEAGQVGSKPGSGS
jgi:hypothetical protein